MITFIAGFIAGALISSFLFKIIFNKLNKVHFNYKIGLPMKKDGIKDVKKQHKKRQKE